MIPSSWRPAAWWFYAAARRLIGHEKILLWPPFEDERSLSEIHARLCFQYGAEKEILIPVRQADLRPSADLPSYLPRYEQAFRSTYFVTERSELPLLTSALRHRAVLYWKTPQEESVRRRIARLPNCAIIDPEQCEEESGEIGWIEVMSTHRDRAAHRRRFFEWRDKLPKRERTYLLCTGPSLARFDEFDFSDGYVVACNTAVTNDALLEHARPDFIVAIDSIYHFGPSNYACAFRRDLASAAERHEFLFCTSDLHHHIVERSLDLSNERICEIPLRSGTEFVKLTERWRLPRIGNVLTQIMMPIAHTLAPEICIIGADGREQGESSFWKHDPASQIGDRMKDLQQCHPAFFAKRDYVAYYAEHCETLRAQIETHESEGGSVSSLTPSFIPALAERHSTISS